MSGISIDVAEARDGLPRIISSFSFDGKVFLVTDKDGGISTVEGSMDEAAEYMRNLYSGVHAELLTDEYKAVLPRLHEVAKLSALMDLKVLDSKEEACVYKLDDGHALLCTGPGAMEWHLSGLAPLDKNDNKNEEKEGI